MNPPSSSPSEWRSAYTVLCATLALFLAIYWHTAASTVALWLTPAFSHAFIVVPVAGYLAWRRRARFESSSPVPTLTAMPFLAAFAFAWLLGRLTATGVVQHITLVAMIVGIVWGVLGTSAARALAFPLTFLFFTVPVGERLIPILQDFTARFAGMMLDASGVPVLLDGHVIAVSGGSWQVARACSGISYLFASLSIGYLYAGLAYRSWNRRVAFFIASAVVPILANGLRVYTVILIAALGGTGIASGIEHYLYGWMFFAMIMACLFAIGGLWHERPSPVRSSVPPDLTRPSPADRLKVIQALTWRTTAIAVLGVAVVGAAPVSAALLSRGSDTAKRDIRVAAPVASLPWKAVERDVYAWTPRFHDPSTEVLQSYVSGPHSVKLYAAYFAPGQPDVKLVTVGNSLFNEAWSPVEETGSPVIISGHSFRIQETVVRTAGSSLVLWSWYLVDGTMTSNDYIAKLLFAKTKLLGSRQPSAAFVLATDDRPERGEATAVLRDFLAHASLPAGAEVRR